MVITEEPTAKPAVLPAPSGSKRQRPGDGSSSRQGGSSRRTCAASDTWPRPDLLCSHTRKSSGWAAREKTILRNLKYTHQNIIKIKNIRNIKGDVTLETIKDYYLYGTSMRKQYVNMSKLCPNKCIVEFKRNFTKTRPNWSWHNLVVHCWPKGVPPISMKNANVGNDQNATVKVDQMWQKCQ